MANKLELTWYGKDKPIAVEPRLLIENAALSNCGGDPDTIQTRLEEWDGRCCAFLSRGNAYENRIADKNVRMARLSEKE